MLALVMLLPYLLARWRGWPGVTHTQGDGWRWRWRGCFLGAILLWLVPMVSVAL